MGSAGGTPTLLRALGPGMAVAVVVGNVIGSGIFAKPGTIAADAGEFGLILATWVFGGLLCLLGALCFAELATELPQAGGLYVYLREAYGRLVAFLFGWNELLFSRPASIGALSTIFIGSLLKAAGWEFGPLPRLLLAVALIAAMAWVNILGVLWGGWVQTITTLVKAGFLAVVALLPFVLLALGSGQVTAQNFASTTPAAESSPLLHRFGLALLAVMWAYNGWHGITPVAEEVREPQRNIPRALFGGIGILILLYVSANVAYHGVLSMEELAAAGEHGAEEMMGRLLGHAGLAVMSAVIMCSTFGAINSNLLIAPRVAFAMGRDAVFFRSLGQVHARFRTPAVAIAVQAAMAVALVIASALLVFFAQGFEGRSVFDMLTDFVIFGASIFYVLAAGAVVVLRRKYPDWERPYRTWGYPVVPLLFVVVYVWFLSQVYVGKPFEAKAGLVLIGLGVPVYWCWQRSGLGAGGRGPAG